MNYQHQSTLAHIHVFFTILDAQWKRACYHWNYLVLEIPNLSYAILSQNWLMLGETLNINMPFSDEIP